MIHWKLVVFLVFVGIMAGRGECYQLVPYKPDYDNPILPMFHQENRSFSFAGREWIIKQQWEEIGVAAVVWESVSFYSTLFYMCELKVVILCSYNIKCYFIPIPPALVSHCQILYQLQHGKWVWLTEIRQFLFVP